MSQCHDVRVGSLLKIASIELNNIRYRDWIEERPPEVGDVAEIVTIFDSSESTVQLNCEPKKGFPIWRINISLNDLKYEILSNE